MAEENKQAEEEIEEEDVKKIFYGPQFLYGFILKHKEELGLPKDFKIDTGRRFSGVLYSTRNQVYSPFRTTYKNPHLSQPIIEKGKAVANNIKLNKTIKGKEDKIWGLMEKDGLPQIYKDGEEIKFKISNRNDFDDLLKTPKEFNKVVNHDIEYNFNKITNIIENNNKELNKLKEIKTNNDNIEKQLKKLRLKNKTDEEEKQYNILLNSKVEIKNLNGNIKKLEEEIKKAKEYKDSLEGKYNKYIENKDKAKKYRKEYETKLNIEKDNIENRYNEKLKNIEESNEKEIEKIKQNTDITAKEKEKKIKDLEKTHKAAIEKLEKDKEKLEDDYYAKIDELEEKKHDIDFLGKKVEEIENVVKAKNAEIDTKRNMLAHANAKRHEAEVEKKQLKEELKNKSEQPNPTYQPSNTPPTLKDYIKDKVINKSYSLEKDELIKVIEKDIDEHKLPKDIDVTKLADTIYLQGAKYINKHMKKIKSLVKLTGYDNDLYNKLPPELADEIQKYIHDKALEDIRKKNIRYILPKEMPRWEKAVNKGINPMLGRGAWSK